MLDALVAGLEWTYRFSTPLIWLSIALFVLGAVTERAERVGPEQTRWVYAVAWVTLTLYWVAMIHYFTVRRTSLVEGIAVVAGVPLSLYIAYLIASGRESLFTLSRAVAAMGLFYMPMVAVPVVRQFLVETVARHTEIVLNAVGVYPRMVDGLTVDGYRIAEKTHPYRSTFVYYVDGDPLTHTIVIACTGIGSMAIVAGLVAAVEAPLSRKLQALAVALPVIYVLNVARNVFISASMGRQLLHVFPEFIISAFALEHSVMVSYIVADRLIAQTLSVVALVGILWLIVRYVPEVLSVVEEALTLLTGREYDLTTAFGTSR